MSGNEVDPRLHRLISHLVANQLGSAATWRIYDRSLPTPMNVALDEAARQLGHEFVVVWVDGGYPEIFTLTGIPVATAVFSTRYLELSSVVRNVVTLDALSSGVRLDLACRTALKIIAELSLLRGNREAAVRCFAQSVIGQGMWLPDRDVLASLEHSRISEAYMGLWFFGLIHELGHSAPSAVHEEGPLGTAELEHLVRTGLEQFSAAAQIDIDEQFAAIREDPLHPLRPEHLRAEAGADLFAASVLLQATIDIMARVGGADFHPARYIAEMATCANTIIFIERCSGIARMLAATRSEQTLQRFLVQPAGQFARLCVIQWYLASALAHHYAGDAAPGRAHLERWHQIVADVTDVHREAIQLLESGLAKAMSFALWPNTGPTTPDLVRALNRELDDSNSGLALAEAQRFCHLADTAGVTGDLIDALHHAIRGRSS